MLLVNLSSLIIIIILKSCYIIDVPVPVYKNSVKKIAEKITKSIETYEIQKCWGISEESKGSINCCRRTRYSILLTENLKLLSSRAKLAVIQKTALLVTAHILRNVLTSKSN